MVVLYHGFNSKSCRKARHWFREHHINVDEKRIRCISREDLLSALRLSERGFRDLLKRSEHCDERLSALIEHTMNLTFLEAVDFTLENPDVLKVPLILDENKLVIGYNTETIRVFIPQSYRNIERLAIRKVSKGVCSSI